LKENPQKLPFENFPNCVTTSFVIPPSFLVIEF
jgi:hypothetical protein